MRRRRASPARARWGRSARQAPGRSPRLRGGVSGGPWFPRRVSPRIAQPRRSIRDLGGTAHQRERRGRRAPDDAKGMPGDENAMDLATTYQESGWYDTGERIPARDGAMKHRRPIDPPGGPAGGVVTADRPVAGAS